MALGSFLLPVLVLAQAGPTSPAAVAEQLRSARLEPLRAVEASGQTIDLALGRLELTRGIIVPASPVSGERLEMVFVGEGRFTITVTDPVEAAQLELFTGGRSLDISVEQAVLALGDPEAAAAILRAPPAVTDDAALERAETMFRHWTGRARRRGFGADHALFRAGVGDPLGRGYVGLWGSSESIGDFYCRIDPTEAEPLALGSYTILEREVEDQEDEEGEETEQQGKKKKDRTKIEWVVWAKIWVSSLLPREVSGLPGSPGVEPESYAIELDLEGDDLAARGEARILLRPELSGLRTVSLNLMEELEVEEVRDGEQRELRWHRIDRFVHVLLPEPTERGRTLELAVLYQGKPLEQLNNFSFALRDTSAWYPHAGQLDRAVYDLTFRWPERLQLLASGALVEEGVEDGRRRQRRRMDVATTHVSFEVGLFDVVTEQVGHVELTVAFNRIRGPLDLETQQEAVSALKGVLLFYESMFGALPVDQLTVVTTDRDFSQGFLGFLTLVHQMFVPRDTRGFFVRAARGLVDTRPRREVRLETLAHEMSHQWWGNLVGWAGYRDQWLSEALADYSAVLFMRRISTREPLYLAGHARGWHEALAQRNNEGRSFASLGPVVLGRRLGVNHSAAAYQAVVYDKGSVVFSMLSALLGEEPLQQMLRTLVDVVGNRVISTEAFLKALERMSGEDLHPFAWQYVFGTAFPDVHYEYLTSRREDGGWLIEGTAHLVAEGEVRFRALRREPKGWDVIREPLRTIDLADWSMPVPFQIPPASADAGNDANTAAGVGGMLELRGATTRFSIPLDAEPGDLWLDQRGEVLAEFFCDTREPKRGLRRRAEILSHNGERAEAEALFLDALQAPLRGGSAPEPAVASELLENEARLQDAAIRIELARIHLDNDEDESAASALRLVEESTAGNEGLFLGERIVLESRLDLRAGRYAPAYHRLYGYLVAHPGGLAEIVRAKVGRTTWIIDEVEAIALLAIAATKTKRWDVAEQATAAAEWLGADMTVLEDDSRR